MCAKQKTKSLIDAIGNTPLVQINFDTAARVFAKLEYTNPGGSIKDRSARFLIEHAEQSGQLQPGGMIVDASSGNHAIAVAMIGAAKGYRVTMCVSKKISQEKLATLKAYGAHVVMCPVTTDLFHSDSYYTTAQRIAQQTPGAHMLNQYFNVHNRHAHYWSLGPEIWQQTDGNITHLIAAAGTGGTISGAGAFLKEQNPNITLIAVDAANSWRSTGGHPKPYHVEGIGIDFETPVLAKNLIDEFIPVTDHEAFGMYTHLARTHGLLVGPSSGAVSHATKEYAKRLSRDACVVMIFGDSGRAYLTKTTS